MKYALILNHFDGKAYVIPLNETDERVLKNQGWEGLIELYDFSPDDCSVLITDKIPVFINVKNNN